MKLAGAILRRLRRQDGQTLPIVAGMLVCLIGFLGLVFDVGRIWVTQQALQGAVDSAALIAGQGLPNATTSYTSAVVYSGAAGDKNAIGGWGVSASPASVTFECLSHAPNYTSGTCPADTSSTSCKPAGAQAPQPTGATTCNAVHVTESATVNMTFLGLFQSSVTVTSSSTAAARGGVPHPVDAYVILDNTQSMSSACSATVTGITSPDKLDCAKAGVQALLQALWPCTSTLASCGTATANSGGQLGANVAAPVDRVGMEVFPAITGNPPSTTILNKEIDCNASSSFSVSYPTYTPYTYSSGASDGGIPTSDAYIGYQAVGLSSDFRPSVANTTLNWTTSNLVESVDWGQCAGSAYPGPGDNYGLKVIGGQGSYLAGAITEAQHLLNVNGRVGAMKAIIVVSDGQMNDPSGFTDTKPCGSAINAATQAKAAGTTIYAIAYGATGTSCPDSSPTHTDLQTMQSIATSGETFFDEPTTGDLTQDFSQVGTDLSDSRLIPDCTVAPPGC